MLTLLRPTTVWPNDASASVIEKIQNWTDEMIGIIAQHTPDESYQNFPNRNLRDPLKAYYGVNLQRLKDVKKIYDPYDLFKNAQSIPTA